MTIFRIGKSGRILGSSSISHLQALRAPITRYGSTKSQAGSNDSQPAYRPFQHPKTSTQSSSDLEIQARVKKLRKQTLYVGAGLIVFFGSMYATSKFVRGEPKAPHVLPDEDVSNRYDHIAATFDKSVGSVESWSGINRLRKKLMKEVSGNVLEVSVGTGRNSDYYKETLCQSITMVDQSKAMIEIAQKTFKGEIPC